VGEGAGLACKKTVVPKPKLRSVIPPKPEGVIPSRMSGELMESEDYMNEVPEGVFHTYSNHKELLEQVCVVQVSLFLCLWCTALLSTLCN
jgi:hypothetical protein